MFTPGTKWALGEKQLGMVSWWGRGGTWPEQSRHYSVYHISEGPRSLWASPLRYYEWDSIQLEWGKGGTRRDVTKGCGASATKGSCRAALLEGEASACAFKTLRHFYFETVCSEAAFATSVTAALGRFF